MRAREALAAEIERMVDLLDAIDGDPDLEETGDLEPSLGHYSGTANVADLEQDESDDEDGADAEPSLGSLDRASDQTRWAESNAFGVDGELDRSDFEEVSWSNPLGARLNGRCQLIVERVPDRQISGSYCSSRTASQVRPRSRLCAQTA